MIFSLTVNRWRSVVNTRWMKWLTWILPLDDSGSNVKINTSEPKLWMMIHSYLNRLSSPALPDQARLQTSQSFVVQEEIWLTSPPVSHIASALHRAYWFPFHIKAAVSYLQMFSPSLAYGSGRGMCGLGWQKGRLQQKTLICLDPDLKGNDPGEVCVCSSQREKRKPDGFHLAVWWMRAARIKS